MPNPPHSAPNNHLWYMHRKKKKNQLADKKIIDPHKYVIGCFKIKALQLRTYPRINLAKIKVSLKVPTQQRFMIEVHCIIICGKENVE